MKRCLITALSALLLAAAAAEAEAAETSAPDRSAKAPKSDTRAKASAGQIKKIKLRMTRRYEGGKPSDEAVQEILARMNPDGSFTNVDYDDTTFNCGGRKTPHLADLAKLSRAYATTPGTYYRDRELYDAITRSVAFWVDRNLEDKNWWHRIIGWPKNLIPTLVLVGEDMKRYDRALYDRLIDYMSYSWSLPKQRAQEGANGTDICQVTFTAAVSSENGELLQEVIDKVNTLVKIAEGDREEGIQSDFSFTQHNGSGRQLYLATYGRDYVDGLLFFLDFTAGTDYWLAPEKVEIIERLFLDGLAWTWYEGEIDVNQYGRGLLRASTAPSFLSFAQRLAAFGTPRADELKRLISFMKGSQELNGNRMFPRADYMIHRPEGAMIATRMTSTRTVGNEAGNSEGMSNYHTGDGACYIKVHGDEYNPIFAGWNWRRIPGTTVAADRRKLPAPMWGEGGAGGSDYASGASDGRNGVCAFIYAKDSLTAHKGWFFFDRYCVALGAGIATARTDAPVLTTVNQTMLSGKIQTSADRLWHYDTGYRFEEGTRHVTENYAGSYPDGHKGRKADILWIGIDHGTAPQGASYAYAVYPAISAADFMARDADYRILANSAAVQAVQDLATGKTLAAFYEPGSIEADGFGTIAVDRPCLVIVDRRDGATLITAANPYCESRPAERITVTVGGRQAAVPLAASTSGSAVL